jgi:hypothetical protein
MIGGVGCAPMSFMDGVRYAADQRGVRDASTLCVARRGYLRFDVRLRSDLDDVIRLEDLDGMKSQGARVLRDARGIAIEAVAGEINRMPPDGIDFIVRWYHVGLVTSDIAAKREAIKRRFDAESDVALQEDLKRLKESTTAAEARRFLRAVLYWIEAPVGDRGKAVRVLAAGPLFLPAALGAEIADAESQQRQVEAMFEQIIRYRPANAESQPTAEQLERADPEALAKWYAPIFIQEHDPSADYAPVNDQIGRVYLSGSPDKIEVHVKIEEPVVYWTTQHAKIGDKHYDQLVYVAWYPSRPALTPDDSEAGHIDGVVVRMTLDSRKRPAVYEFVRSCGCYHTLWVAEFVEAAARGAFGKPAGSNRFAVQKAKELGRRELFLPELVSDDGSFPHRPSAYVSAGHHLLLTIGVQEQDTPSLKVLAERTYRLEPYKTLTWLPLDDGVASMFGADGLVHNAGRKAGWLLAPTGMLSAGQPRQLGTMKIRMDSYDYDDPRLLERNLRFPPEF